MYLFISVFIYLFIYLFMHLYIYIYIHTYVYVYIHCTHNVSDAVHEFFFCLCWLSCLFAMGRRAKAPRFADHLAGSAVTPWLSGFNHRTKWVTNWQLFAWLWKP